ncbi:6349_t:CDS:2 [Diversispora eburnea]|uniref:6349_t:CDS:1 n=1 Tax=Diversispora eburnea TaxID=1213867 RepID=A0A9N9BWV2_9GLOM|nr:6349_t:CDS:2 [Diversispora eburnea]
MPNLEHESVVSMLFKCFDRPNNGVLRGHYDPSNPALKIEPDLAIYPHIAHVPKPTVTHPGPPPSNANVL